MRRTQAVRLGLALTATLLAMGMPATAHAAYAWQDGAIQESQITNCESIIQGSPYQEAGAGAYAGAYLDPNALPHIGDLYYVHVVIYGLGNSCSGQYADIQIGLPDGTAPAISATYPVKCFLNFAPESTYPHGHTVQDTESSCPQASTGGQYGYEFDPPPGTVPNGPPFWPIPQGGGVEIQIPVRSTKPVSSATALTGAVTMADGNSDPTLTPTALLQIGDLTPTIVYPTNAGAYPVTTTTATVQAAVYNYYRAGTIYTELGTTTAYGHTQGPDPVESSYYGIQDYTGWSGLQPGCTYDWRVYFVPEGGGTPAYGSNQTIKTSGSGGNCAGSAFTSFTPEPAPPITFPQPNEGAAPQPGAPAAPTPPPGTQTGPTSTTPVAAPTATTAPPNITPASSAAAAASAPPPSAFVVLALPAVQHGSSLSATLDIGQGDSRVELDAYATGAHAAARRGKGRPKPLLLARMTRTGVAAGKLKLTVPLNAVGRRELKRHHHLTLRVTIAVTPPGGKQLSSTRAVTLR
jgi:hypothetical protein